MSDYLVLISIGPVQEFIAAARRTRDLWFGSWLLSELSRAAAQKVVDLGGTLIFPHPQVLTSLAESEISIPVRRPAKVANKIVAAIATDDMAQTGENIRLEVQSKLLMLRKAAFDTVKDWTHGDLILAQQQVDTLIECYWAAVPFPDPAAYSKQRTLLEEVMAARKGTRHFGQVELTETQRRYPKSSLDGQRESVIRESAYPNRDDDTATRRTKLLSLFRTFGAKQAERLSGVDLLKRRGNHKADEADFPSTSHFAALPFLQSLAKKHGSTKIHDLFIHYRDSLEELVVNGKMVRLETLEECYRVPFDVIDNYDASILYMSRLAEEIDARDNQTRSYAERELRQFLALAANGAEPKSYYAILQADGDGMGMVIDNQSRVEAHQDLSEQLANFAGEAESIVQRNRGALVYAGGDDVLALLPVDTVLACAKELHDRFDTIVGRELRDETGNTRFISKAQVPATLSVGIAICHHLEPLNDGLELVRSAEKRAKQVTGKNGLAIAIAKRSGEPQLIKGSWAADTGFLTRLETWLRLMQDTDLSAGAPYELRDLTERLAEPQRLDPKQQTVHRAIAEEAGRIIERKQGQRGSKKLVPADIATLREWLGLPKTEVINTTTRFVLADDGERYGEQKLTVRQLADELIVVRELVRLGAVRFQGGEE